MILAFLFKPSTTPLEISFCARKVFKSKTFGRALRVESPFRCVSRLQRIDREEISSTTAAE